MFACLAYFIVLLAACSCQTTTPTDPTKPKNISGIFWRYFPNDVDHFSDVSIDKGVDILGLVTFDKYEKTVIFAEGWKQNANSPAPQQLVEAQLNNLHANQIIFDWSNINTDSNYVNVASQVEKVGTALGEQLCKMFAAGLEPNQTELIGFSLGAHVAGQAGKTVKETCNHSFRSSNGTYYLTTNSASPYGKGDAGLCT